MLIEKGPSKQTHLADYLQPDVFPPHGAVEAPRVPLEGESLSLQAVRGLHQQLDALTAFQHLLTRTKATPVVCSKVSRLLND